MCLTSQGLDCKVKVPVLAARFGEGNELHRSSIEVMTSWRAFGLPLIWSRSSPARLGPNACFSSYLDLVPVNVSDCRWNEEWNAGLVSNIKLWLAFTQSSILGLHSIWRPWGTSLTLLFWYIKVLELYSMLLILANVGFKIEREVNGVSLQYSIVFTVYLSEFCLMLKRIILS